MIILFTQKTPVKKFGSFLKVADYLTFGVPMEYHAFALELSDVALFEEYIRGRITALDIRDQHDQIRL